MKIRKNKPLSREQEIEAAKYFGRHMPRDKMLFCFFTAALMAMLPSIAGLSHFEDIPLIIETGLVNAEGQDDSLPRWALVFLLPGVFTLCTVICHAQLWIHQAKQTLPPKQIRLLGRWSVAVISVFFCTWAEYSAIGESYSVVQCVLGVALVLVGASLYGCKRGDVLSLPFSFVKRSDRIWERTHRVCAVSQTAAGFVVLLSVMLYGTLTSAGFFIVPVLIFLPVLVEYIRAK